MDVHERLPSGLTPDALRALSRRSPRRARSVVVRLVVGFAGVLAVMAPLGLVWVVLGVALLVSTLPALRDAGAARVEAPALVLDSRPGWAGQRFTAWRLETDGLSSEAVDGVVARMRELLDDEAGPSAEVGDEATTRAAWALGGEVAIDAVEEVSGRSSSGTAPGAGVWLRIDRPAGDRPWVVTWLAVEGASTEVLRRAASVAS